jgi:hypothetical protein
MSPACGRAQHLRTHQTHSVPVCGRDRLDLRQGHKEHERQNRTLMQTPGASTHRQSRRSRHSSCQPRSRGQCLLTRTHPRTPKRSRAPPGLAARPQARASQPKSMPLPCLMSHQDDKTSSFKIVRYSRNSRNWYCLNTVVRVVLTKLDTCVLPNPWLET